MTHLVRLIGKSNAVTDTTKDRLTLQDGTTMIGDHSENRECRYTSQHQEKSPSSTYKREQGEEDTGWVCSVAQGMQCMHCGQSCNARKDH